MTLCNARSVTETRHERDGFVTGPSTREAEILTQRIELSWESSYRAYGVAQLHARALPGQPTTADTVRLLAVWFRWPEPVRVRVRWVAAVGGLPLAAAAWSICAAMWDVATLAEWCEMDAHMREAA